MTRVRLSASSGPQVLDAIARLAPLLIAQVDHAQLGLAYRRPGFGDVGAQTAEVRMQIGFSALEGVVPGLQVDAHLQQRLGAAQLLGDVAELGARGVGFGFPSGDLLARLLLTLREHVELAAQGGLAAGQKLGFAVEQPRNPGVVAACEQLGRKRRARPAVAFGVEAG
jgi:hypothetical protein